MTIPAIDVRGLTKKYGRTTALDGIDLQVETGSVFGVIGPNGAGKTTTMRLLLDIIRPTSGDIRVLGENPRAAGRALRRRIGFLPGELRLDARITGHSLLDHYAQISGPTEPAVISSLADRLGLDLSRPVRTLSKGNKQKLGIVQAFMHRPPLLVLDEPTSGLDPIVQQEFLTLVKEASIAGQTVFLSSHVLSEIQQAADSVAILRAGNVISVSDVDSLRLTAVRRIRGRVRGADAATIDRVLRAVPHVSGLTVSVAPDAVDAVTLTATVEGDIDPFITTIAQLSILDLAVEEPDLEESVLRLYGSSPTEGSPVEEKGNSDVR